MKQPRTMVIGDIHGRHAALLEVLDKSEFNYVRDVLIVLGDVVDGGRNTREVVDELLKIRNRIFILGNHDAWFKQWLAFGTELPVWYHQGGQATIESYGYDRNNVPQSHREFFESWISYYLDNKRRMFVHGGFVPGKPIDLNNPTTPNYLYTLTWDRDLIEYARKRKVPKYAEVFVGHTTTQHYGSDKPVQFNNLTMMDCGAGWDGKLAIMDVDTREYWLSKKQVAGR